jgi:hypothetical protein
MPTLDKITLTAQATRLRWGSRAGDVRRQWCEACREAHVWCDRCGSLSCRHVLEARTVPASRLWRAGRIAERKGRGMISV